MLKEIAQLREFSNASESETFDKISKMNQNIAAKNKEIADLTRARRADQKALQRVCVVVFCQM
jgi:hypothetical protein